MKIAIYHNLPSGGAKRTLGEVTRRLTSRHQIDVYTLSSADHTFSDLAPWVAGHEVIPFRPLPLLRSPLGRLNQAIRAADLVRLDGVARRVARRIDAGGYDVAFIQPCRFEQTPSVLRYLASTPSVYYCHESNRLLYEPMPSRPHDDEAIGHRRLLNALDPLPGLYRRRLRTVDQRNLRKARKVLVNSTFTAGEVARIYGVAAEVSYHGVDTERFKPLHLEKQNFVLSVGSLTRLKGFDFLIDALGRCPESTRPPLVIASNFDAPMERAYLEELARTRKVDLRLQGNVSDEDLVRLYNEAPVVVYAPVREPFGLVPVEAMACGTPVVAVAEGGIPESVVDGETGLLTARDPGQFAQALERLLRDPATARHYGERGRAQVENRWTWDRAATRLEGHFASVASRPAYAAVGAASA